MDGEIKLPGKRRRGKPEPKIIPMYSRYGRTEYVSPDRNIKPVSMDEDVMNELLKNVILAQTRDQIEASYDSIRLPGTPQLPGPQLGA